MPNKDKPTETASVGTEELLLALISLEVDKRERSLDSSQLKTELLLANTGLGYQQIAKIMGKNPAAVRMMITRSKTNSTTKKTTKASE